MRWGLAATALACLTAACATPAGAPAVLVFGEQHDQPDQQRQVADAVQELAARGALAAVVLEMADRGRSTAALPRDATPEQVRAALAWSGWPWDAYAGIVMNAVRAGVPVLGGNLPRTATRATMGDATLDAQVTPAVRQTLAEAVRSGHCGLLPAAAEPGMVRVQVARDRAMAQTVAEAAAQAGGRTVLLHTGAQHAARDRGVPQHLPPTLPLRVVMFGNGADGLMADERRPAAVTPRPDPCESLRRRPPAPAG